MSQRHLFGLFTLALSLVTNLFWFDFWRQAAVLMVVPLAMAALCPMLDLGLFRYPRFVGPDGRIGRERGAKGAGWSCAEHWHGKYDCSHRSA